jgi:DNA-binding response OmpR family regulator
MESKMNAKTRETILLIGNDPTLRYLLGRFVDQSGSALAVVPLITSAQQITEINPKAIIFLSMELLEKTQTLVVELASLEVPIMVCSSVSEETRARELGADYCLLHPLTYEDFQTTLALASASKHP